jgi:hypothetical protein
MKWSGLATVSCTALVLAAIADEASAGGRGSGRSSAGVSRGHSGHHHHRHHFHSRIFIGAPLFWGSYYGPGYYYSPPPPVYIEQSPAPLEQDSQYWYFCPSARSYYPYVGECPEGWQRVLPQPNPQPPAG